MEHSKYNIEIEYFQKNKYGNHVCGDHFVSKKVQNENRVIAVLSDGLGSGIKASVLASITASMALNFTLRHEPIVRTAKTIMATLPEDKYRKISYATFSILDIDSFGEAKVIEYDNPPYLIIRDKEVFTPRKELSILKREKLSDARMYISTFNIKKEDRIIFFSDGVSQSGMGSKTMPLGWSDDVANFVIKIIKNDPYISAKSLAHKIVNKAEQNDGLKLKDDTTCNVIYVRNPRNLLICSGPPYDENRDAQLGDLVKNFKGKKIICGGTTSTIIARELKKEVEVGLYSSDSSLPPASKMEGVDLVTEGILTIGKVAELLEKTDYKGISSKGPAADITEMLLSSDKITFIIGTRINIAHQDPNLPVELEIRRIVIKKIKNILEDKFLKEVELIFI